MTGAEPAVTASLARRVQRGSVWGAVNIVTTRLLQFLLTLALARILAPDQFGALAIALVAQTIALNVTELGTTASIARADRDPDSIAPTVLTISLATGVVLGVVMTLAAPVIAGALGDASATSVVQVMSITVVLAGAASLPTALVWRDFLQRRRVVVDASSNVIAIAIAIPLALLGWGALAMAWSRVGAQLVSTIGYWIIAPHRYRPGWDRSEVPALLRLGLPLAASNLVAFVMLNVDYIVVGRELGPTQLGLYLLAFNLAALPSSVITTIIRTVAVPAFGRLHTAGSLGDLTPRFVRAVAWTCFPIAALIGGLAAPLLTSLYGDRWAPAATALLGLAVFGTARVLSELFSDLLVGAGRTVGLFWVQAIWLVALVPTMVGFVSWWGIAGAGWAHTAVAWLVVIPIYLVLIVRHVGTGWVRAVTAFLPSAAIAGAAGILAWMISGAFASPWAALIVGGAGGLAIYIALSTPVWRPLLREFRSRT